MKIKFFVTLITNLLLVVSSFAALSSKDKFNEAFKNLDQAPKFELKQHKEPFLDAELIKKLAGISRIKARILKIDEKSIQVDQNNLYFQKKKDVCIQEASSITKYYGLRTVCIREDYILMDFTFRYKKKESL